MVEAIEDDGIEAELIRRGPLIRSHGLAEARYMAHMPRVQGSSANRLPLIPVLYLAWFEKLSERCSEPREKSNM